MMTRIPTPRSSEGGPRLLKVRVVVLQGGNGIWSEPSKNFFRLVVDISLFEERPLFSAPSLPIPTGPMSRSGSGPGSQRDPLRRPSHRPCPLGRDDRDQNRALLPPYGPKEGIDPRSRRESNGPELRHRGKKVRLGLQFPRAM